jgi:hypothetical protein
MVLFLSCRGVLLLLVRLPLLSAVPWFTIIKLTARPKNSDSQVAASKPAVVKTLSREAAALDFGQIPVHGVQGGGGEHNHLPIDTVEGGAMWSEESAKIQEPNWQ